MNGEKKDDRSSPEANAQEQMAAQRATGGELTAPPVVETSKNEDDDWGEDFSEEAVKIQAYPIDYAYKRPIYDEDDTSSLHSCHDDRSFSSRSIGYVKPQQSPYKKAGPPLTSAPIKPRAIPVIKPKAPDVVLKAGVDPDIQKSESTEELSAEMANLDCLMKDLNAITQQNFEV